MVLSKKEKKRNNAEKQTERRYKMSVSLWAKKVKREIDREIDKGTLFGSVLFGLCIMWLIVMSVFLFLTSPLWIVPYLIHLGRR